MLPPLYFNCTYIFSLQSCVPVKSKCDDSQAGRQVSSDLWRCDPCYEHTAVVTAVNTLENADIPVSHLRFFMPMWSCSLLFAEYVALYPYSSSEPGDLTFMEGEEILVTQKEGEWWTGSINNRTGIFPSNYVRPKDPDVSSYSES